MWGGGIPPVRKWDPNMTKKRHLNEEDNQAPQPTMYLKLWIRG
jgi:hypothetical protein